MKSKIDIDKFVCSLLEYANDNCEEIWVDYLCSSLQDQGLKCVDGEIVELNLPQSDKDSDKEQREKECENVTSDFALKVSEILYKVSQNPTHFEGDPDYMVYTASKELLELAKKQLEADPEFLYTVTRKAAERAREEFMEKAKRFIRDAFGSLRYDFMINVFNKYMKGNERYSPLL